MTADGRAWLSQLLCYEQFWKRRDKVYYKSNFKGLKTQIYRKKIRFLVKKGLETLILAKFLN